jgi:hypothetical protein
MTSVPPVQILQRACNGTPCAYRVSSGRSISVNFALKALDEWVAYLTVCERLMTHGALLCGDLDGECLALGCEWQSAGCLKP